MMRGVLEASVVGRLKLQAIAVVVRTISSLQGAPDPCIEQVELEKIPAITTALAAQEMISQAVHSYCGTLAEAIQLVSNIILPQLLKSLGSLNNAHAAAKRTTRAVDKVLLGKPHAERFVRGGPGAQRR